MKRQGGKIHLIWLPAAILNSLAVWRSSGLLGLLGSLLLAVALIVLAKRGTFARRRD
jgi:hypothetical protein